MSDWNVSQKQNQRKTEEILLEMIFLIDLHEFFRLAIVKCH